MVFETPVFIQIFNRADLFEKILQNVKAIKPKNLYIVADGPRANVESDYENCKKARDVLRKIDWDCDLRTKFFDQNLGSYEAYVQGVTWLFSKEEKAIILEDDDLPHSAFFAYCEYFLEKYKSDQRIFGITGNNFDKSKKYNRPFFSQIPSAWGWATWSRTWNTLDFEFSFAETLKEQNFLNLYSTISLNTISSMTTLFHGLKRVSAKLGFRTFV